MPLSSIILLVCAFLAMQLAKIFLTNRSFDDGVKVAFSKTNQEAIEIHKEELINEIARLYQNN